MFGWLQRRLLLSSIRSHTGELERFVVSLRGQSPGELGLLLTLAGIVRFNLLSELLTDEFLDCGIGANTIDGLTIPLLLSRRIRNAQKDRHFSMAAGMMVWLHSSRAIQTPELRLLGRQMWAELQRGLPYVDENASVWLGTSGTDPVAGAAYSSRIPEMLKPFV